MVWRCVVYYIVSHPRRDTVWYHTPTVVTLTNSGTCTEHKGRQYILTEQLLSVMYINIAWRSGNIIICIPNTFIILYQTLHLTWIRLVSQNVSLSLMEKNHIPLTYSISFLSFVSMLTSYTQTKKQYHNKSQLLFAMSPLIALFYVIYTGFEPEEVEQKKRAQKGDFQLDGHSE